ncbi:hypothetical protein ACOZ4N_01290 (plasmid) [Halorientalis pallida]|uniref:hypothetical protein n=1 Tax=Halorientalis pallida TaxID=2479928 RepID=UPI003C6F03D7
MSSSLSSKSPNEQQDEQAESDTDTPPSSDHSDSNPTLSLVDLLHRETIIPFAGLTDDSVGTYPDDVATSGRCFANSPRPFKAVIQALPRASEGELWATNEFVATDETVDVNAIRDVDGLDTDALESLVGRSIDSLAANAEAEPIVPVRDNKDIVDERRKALHALGYDVKFRWQIASDSYTIINPQAAYLPIVNALQRRGDEDVFGWASYRDWGGLLKMVVICPSLRHVVTDPDEDEIDLDNEIDGISDQQPEEASDDDLVVYGGFQTGYDFRGTQTLWARPILFFPETSTVIPDTGERYTRRHSGKATDATHERKNDRVPINEWWRSIYDDIDLRMVDVDQAIQQTRAIAYDFEDLPFSLEDCYQYWGVAHKYAEVAAERATRLAAPPTRPTVFNIQLSLLIALLDEYDGSHASNTYQEYLEVAGELYRKPAMMIQLALREHDRQADEDTMRILADDQQTLSDALEDIVDIPGIEVDTETDLSNAQAQRVQDHVQRTFGDLSKS